MSLFRSQFCFAMLIVALIFSVQDSAVAHPLHSGTAPHICHDVRNSHWQHYYPRGFSIYAYQQQLNAYNQNRFSGPRNPPPPPPNEDISFSANHYFPPARIYPEPVQASDFWGSGKDEAFFWGENHQTPSIPPLAAPLRTGITTYNYVPTLHLPIEKQKITPDLKQEFKQADELLLNLHERNTLGTLDIDVYSQELLCIKKDYAAATQNNPQLSSRRETALRKNLNNLICELEKRTR